MSSLLSKIEMPIQKGEWPKFLTTALMLLFVLYVYSILRSSKDAIVVSLMSAELISTLKLYGTLPIAVLFMLLYTKLVDVFSKIQLFHIINWFFAIFFALFAFVLFPNAENIHPNLDYLIESYPRFKYMIIMVSNWSFSLYYILSELWGSVMLTLMFWQLANQVTLIPEAKRFYPMFGFAGQAGLIGAGFLMTLFTQYSAGWGQSLNYIAISILLSCAALSICMTVLSGIVGVDTINGKISMASKSPKEKVKIKMGFIESLKYIMSSKYIGLIAMLVICYGISINLVEGIWKGSVKLIHPDASAFAKYMGEVQIYTGIMTATAMLCGAFVLRLIRWKTAAILTPLMILVTGIGFFLFIVFKGGLSSFIETFGISAMFLAAFFGSLQNVLSKATKYAFFDPTKEMSYIPLDEDLKAKGKAAADVVGGRLGKSGGAFIQWFFLQIVFIGSASLIDLAPYFFGIFLVVMVMWIFAVNALSEEFTKKSAEIE